MQINLTKGKANTLVEKTQSARQGAPENMPRQQLLLKNVSFLTKIHVRLCKARASGRGTVPEPDLAERHAVGLVELEGLAHSREGVRRLAFFF